MRRKAAEFARAYTSGTLPLEQLRAQMADELRITLTAALLSGTGSQTSAVIRATLQRLIARELAELDRLIRLLTQRPDMDVADVQRRLEAFSASLEDAQTEGERLTENPTSPLIPAVIGAALLALIGRMAGSGRTTLPRLDSGAIERVYSTLQQRMDELSDLYANKELLPDEWFIRMERELRVLHTTLYQQGRGGTLTPDDLARIEARVKAQVEFLNGFRDDLAAGKLTPEQIRARARMYLANGQASLQEGATARLGFILPSYPKDGSTICKTSDLCFWRIVQVGPNHFRASWRTRPAENCQTCLNRERLWSAIDIIDGVVGEYSRAGTFA